LISLYSIPLKDLLQFLFFIF